MGRQLSEEHKKKLAEANARRREAIARGEIPPPSLRSRQEHARRVAREPGAREILTSSPEFKAALESALAEKLPAMLAAVAQANKEAGAESPENFAKALALQMAKFTGQGVGKTYVDPDEIEKRAAATRKMKRLLADLRAAGKRPVYRIIRQTQLPVGNLGPIVIEPLWRGPDRIQHDTEIEWSFIPNLAMHPLDDEAKQVFALFETAIGAEKPEVAEPDGLDSPMAMLAPQLGPQALGPGGTVVRGAAASAIIRNDPALREMGAGQRHGPMSPYEAAVIRRGEDPAVRHKQVLGTLTDPIEMR